MARFEDREAVAGKSRNASPESGKSEQRETPLDTGEIRSAINLAGQIVSIDFELWHVELLGGYTIGDGHVVTWLEYKDLLVEVGGDLAFCAADNSCGQQVGRRITRNMPFIRINKNLEDRTCGPIGQPYLVPLSLGSN